MIVGAGPAGTGPLVFAARTNKLKKLLDSGVAILDKGSQMVCGSIGKYIVNSDTYTTVFLECLDGQKEGGVLESVVDLDVTRLLEKYRDTNAPLGLVGEFLTEVGNALQTVIAQHPTSQFFPRTEVRSLQLSAEGTITTRAIAHITDDLSVEQEFCSQTVVLALGGKQHKENSVYAKTIQDLNLTNQLAHKVLLSDFVLTQQGVNEIEKRLHSSSKKVVIIGGSHSAFAAAWTLLNKVTIQFSEGDIKILHRNKVKLCYRSYDEALDDGYTDFSDEDICPTTQKVYRLGGLRTDSKELFRQIMGWSKERREKRISLIEIHQNNDNLTDIETYLNEAALIIYAFGYDTNIVPIYHPDGSEIQPLCNHRGPMVDHSGRVLIKDGPPLSNVLAIGLGAGFQYSEKLGGEKTFKGEINGVWIYQNTIGEILLNQIL